MGDQPESKPARKRGKRAQVPSEPVKGADPFRPPTEGSAWAREEVRLGALPHRPLSEGEPLPPAEVQRLLSAGRAAVVDWVFRRAGLSLAARRQLLPGRW
jgi:hypothetical protein